MKTISDRRKSSYQIYDSFRIMKYYFRLKENFNNGNTKDTVQPHQTQRRALSVYWVSFMTHKKKKRNWVIQERRKSHLIISLQVTFFP